MHRISAAVEHSGAALLAAYELVPPVEIHVLAEQGSNNTMHGVRTGAGSFVLKTYEAIDDRESLWYEHRLLRWLGERELPFAVPVAVAARDGNTLVHGANGLQALFPLLPGRHPDESNPKQLHALGAALSELHLALAAYPRGRRPNMWRYDELKLVHPKVPDPFALTPEAIGLPAEPAIDKLCAWWRGELAALRALIDDRYRALPQQMIHGDYVPSNTLFAGDTLAAILDFEFALPDARAMDLASGFQFTLRPWLPTPNWELVRAVWGGYASRAELNTEEIEALPELMRLRNVTSGVWWLGRFLTDGTPERSVGRLDWVRRCNTCIGRSEKRLLAILRGR